MFLFVCFSTEWNDISVFFIFDRFSADSSHMHFSLYKKKRTKKEKAISRFLSMLFHGTGVNNSRAVETRQMCWGRRRMQRQNGSERNPRRGAVSRCWRLPSIKQASVTALTSHVPEQHLRTSLQDVDGGTACFCQGSLRRDFVRTTRVIPKLKASRKLKKF